MIPRCEVCNSRKNLQGHHTSYQPEKIQILCVGCHLEAHGKKHGVGLSNNVQREIPKNFEELWKTKTYAEIMTICKISFVTVYNWSKKLNLLPKPLYRTVFMAEERPRYWNIPVPAELDDKVEEAVKKDSHISKAELIRDAVRRLLDEVEK